MTSIPPTFPTQVLDRVCAAALCAGTWCGHLHLEFDHRLDSDRLRRAARLLVDAEPWLACRFVAKRPQPVWERIPLAEGDNFILIGSERQYVEYQRRPVDIFQGPLARVAFFRRPSGRDQMALTMTHAISDGPGLFEACRLLAEIYTRLASEPGYRPEPNLTGSRSYRQLLRNIPLRAHFTVLRNVWRQIRDDKKAFPCHKLHIEPGGPPTETNYLFREVDADRAARLGRYVKDRSATMNDLMLTTFLRGLVRAEAWDGKRPLSINSTIDLRRYLPGRRSSAICNLACGQLLTLGHDLGASFDETLARVSRITKALKAHWIGLNAEVVMLPIGALMPYGLLRRLIEKAMAKPATAGWPADSISNVGTLDPSWLTFEAPPTKVLIMPQFLEMPRYQVACYGFRGAILLVSSVYPSLHREQAVTRLYDAMFAELPE